MPENNQEQRQQTMRVTQNASFLVSATDMTGLTAFFAMFLRDTFRIFLEQTGRFIIFPLTALASIIQTVLAFRQSQLSGYKKDLVVKTVVETMAMIAITTAVAGSLAAKAVFATISPIIFTATLSGKALYHVGSAVFYWGKSTGTEATDKKQNYRQKAKAHLIQGIALTLAAVAVSGVMIFGQLALATVGIAAGACSAIYFSLRILSNRQKKQNDYQALPTIDPANENNEHAEQPKGPSLQPSQSSSAIIYSTIGTERLTEVTPPLKDLDSTTDILAEPQASRAHNSSSRGCEAAVAIQSMRC